MSAVASLGYVGLTSTDVPAFRSFATEILGMSVAITPGPDPDAAYLKIDERQWRLAVAPGEQVQVDIRGRPAEARTVKLPFVRKGQCLV